MKQFLYKQIITRGQSALDEGQLNKLGVEGWELTAMTHHANAGQIVYVFKRESGSV